MNPQGSKDNPFGGIEWTHIFGPQTGQTVNPVRGCEHECRWRMPDGKIVVCYAESAHERMHGPGTFKQITFRPEVFDDIRSRRKPAGVFIDSMSDLFGHSVPSEHIVKVIRVMDECHWHVFFTLTKNPKRLLAPMCVFPDNVLVGMSAPPTFMYGKELTPEQQANWFSVGMSALSNCEAKNVWLSLEPLTVDVTQTIKQFKSRLCWAVIGAGSDGPKLYQADVGLMRRTLEALEGVPVFFKGNVSKKLAHELGGWRAEFPDLKRFERNKQGELI